MFAVIRLRGSVGVRKELRETLRILGLHQNNHLVLKPENKSVQSMLKKVEAFIVYGEIDAATLAKVLKKRGCLEGNKRLDETFLKKSGMASFLALAQSILEQKKSLQGLGIKKVFRLHPPRKGFARGGIKKLFSLGGAAGYRGKAINALLQKMV